MKAYRFVLALLVLVIAGIDQVSAQQAGETISFRGNQMLRD